MYWMVSLIYSKLGNTGRGNKLKKQGNPEGWQL